MTLAILGTGGHAKSIFDIVKNKKKIYFFDKQKKFLKLYKKKFIVTNDKLLIKNYKNKVSKIIVAIGDNKTREKKYKFLKKNKFKLATLIHPKSYCGYGSKIGEGSVLLAGSLINTDTVIGNNCIINSNASIDHDCLVKDHTHICPGVTIAGNVKIGKNCWIGLGTKIIQNCIIGDNVFIAAGSVVTKNIKPNSFVKGIPANYAKKRLA
jgi:sugar O-acyltransferase, sialic acid O-acetyltransferase NeuD family